MKKNKKLLIGSLLVIVYALSMAQQTIVNQVWCYKKNGSVDMEITVLSLHCSCSPGRPDYGHFIPYERSRLLCESISCIDQPIENAWLVRDIHLNTFNLAPVKHFVPTGQINTHKNNSPDSFPGAVFLLAKFLPQPLNPNAGVSLRC